MLTDTIPSQLLPALRQAKIILHYPIKYLDKSKCYCRICLSLCDDRFPKAFQANYFLNLNFFFLATFSTPRNSLYNFQGNGLHGIAS
jgi:hypothetical protein